MKKRIFTGISVEPFHSLIQKQRNLFSVNKYIRSVNESNLHLTYFFAGNINVQHINDLYKKLENVSAQQKPFQLFVKEFSIVSLFKEHMIWLEFKHDNAFNQLVNQIQSCFIFENKVTSLHPDRRPHITIARYKPNHVLNDFTLLPVNQNLNLNLNRITVYESILLADGVHYTQLRTFEFNE